MAERRIQQAGSKDSWNRREPCIRSKEEDTQNAVYGARH